MTNAPAQLRIGFIPLTDAAPIIAAQELGYFGRNGLTVELRREVGWATIREKIIYGELDAAQALAPMLWDAQLGVGCAPSSVLTAFVLSRNGNAITVSGKLRGERSSDLGPLKAAIRSRHGERRVTFGVVFPLSSHHLMLRHWLRGAGVDPDRDVRIVVVPPAQMFRNLAAGTIDGYCAGEPWNSLAVQEGAGWCPAWSSSFSPGHVEKVLMVTQRFAERRAQEHGAVIGALAAAAAWCDEPQNREALAEMLAAPRYLNLPPSVMLPALSGRFSPSRGAVESTRDFHIFNRGDANAPLAAHAAALEHELAAAGLLPISPPAGLPARLFREDLYRNALKQNHRHELV